MCRMQLKISCMRQLQNGKFLVVEEGDDFVGGLYYQKWENSDNSYVFLKDSHKVYVYSHLVRVVKFMIPPRNHKVIGNDAIYELLEETL
jgi:hypothetical protein